MIATSTIVDADGRTLIQKRGAGPSDALRIAHEASMLELARHPGVVDLDRGTSDGHGELRTVFAGPRTLASEELTLDTRSIVIAAAAETLADLHALGIVHGRIDESHIVLGDRRRPVLCGFGAAGLAGDTGPDGTRLRPANDVAALGALLGRALAADTDHSRGGARGRRANQLAELRHLVGDATNHEASRRPTARRFAATLDQLTTLEPSPSRTARNTPNRPPASGRTTAWARVRAGVSVMIRARPSGRTLIVAAVLGGILVILGLTEVGTRHAPAGPRSTIGSADRADRADRADAAADDLVGPRPGGEVDIGTHRYAIGQADDAIFVARWGCADHPAVVVVRPSGAVFRFDGWAIPGRDLDGIAIGSLTSPADVRVDRDANGCAVLTAPGPDHSTTLDPEASP